ncbi:hypothetical protein [Chryseobacterium soldanellicola]|uniref:hypothetical protein n=1 Tax=Chryseobacterium soldanellicola TaxID=311333 RepID=UPI000B1A5599|nr:hypothetical protein [Chryseobacterium soldanellicola]
MKLFQIITIIFCLGIFLIPKDNFYLQSVQEKCCKADSKTDCCNNHKAPTKDHDNKTKSSCNDDCCSFCAACYTFIETPFSKNIFLEFSYYKANKNLQFQYSDPYISDSLREIWQPPKLA